MEYIFIITLIVIPFIIVYIKLSRLLCTIENITIINTKCKLKDKYNNILELKQIQDYMIAEYDSENRKLKSKQK